MAAMNNIFEPKKIGTAMQLRVALWSSGFIMYPVYLLTIWFIRTSLIFGLCIGVAFTNGQADAYISCNTPNPTVIIKHTQHFL